MSSTESKKSEIKFYHRSWIGALAIRSWGRIQSASPWTLSAEERYLEISNRSADNDANLVLEHKTPTEGASRSLETHYSVDSSQFSVLDNEVLVADDHSDQNDIGIEIKLSTSNPAFLKVYKKLYNFKRKLFDFSDEQLSSQYKLQRKINDLNVKLLDKVADPNMSTEALIALRHLALEYRVRQQELLKKQPWYKNLLSSSESNKNDNKLISANNASYGLIENNAQS